MKNVNNYGIRCLQDEAQAILGLIPMMDESFSQAVDMIFHCRGKLIVTGVGKSGHVGQKIAATLASLGTPAFFLNPLDAYHGDLGMLSPNDILLAISYSGNTDELLRILPPVIERNIPIIAISSNPTSLLGKHSACHLTVKVDHEADPLNLAPTSSTTATMAMGDALACALVQVRNFKDADFARFHPGGSLGKRLLTKVKDVTKKESLPILNRTMCVKEALTIVSKGRLGLGVVLEGNSVEGLVTSGDIRRALETYGGDTLDMQVSSIMNCNPKTILDESPIVTVEEICKKNNIHSLIVKDKNGFFVGIVDNSNL